MTLVTHNQNMKWWGGVCKWHPRGHMVCTTLSVRLLPLPLVSRSCNMTAKHLQPYHYQQHTYLTYFQNKQST